MSGRNPIGAAVPVGPSAVGAASAVNACRVAVVPVSVGPAVAAGRPARCAARANRRDPARCAARVNRRDPAHCAARANRRRRARVPGRRTAPADGGRADSSADRSSPASGRRRGSRSLRAWPGSTGLSRRHHEARSRRSSVLPRRDRPRPRPTRPVGPAVAADRRPCRHSPDRRHLRAGIHCRSAAPRVRSRPPAPAPLPPPDRPRVRPRRVRPCRVRRPRADRPLTRRVPRPTRRPRSSVAPRRPRPPPPRRRSAARPFRGPIHGRHQHPRARHRRRSCRPRRGPLQEPVPRRAPGRIPHRVLTLPRRLHLRHRAPGISCRWSVPRPAHSPRPPSQWPAPGWPPMT